MAKIVGLYTVGYKTTNGGARRLDLVVMENLFHGHKIVESFDLKGSMRNRLVDPSGNNVQVCLYRGNCPKIFSYHLCQYDPTGQMNDNYCGRNFPTVYAKNNFLDKAILS